MPKADGSVIIDTKINTEGVKDGTKEIKTELEGVSGSSQKASDALGSGLAGGFKKLGAAIVAAGVVDKIIDIGKEAVNLGSDLQEVQNVVDVTFTTMSEKVTDFAKDAKKTAGLSEKMAKQYVGTFGAMADAFGFAEEEAYEMSTTLTQLSGDVASFYNLSQDEAMNKLKGVFTGETEALKELGVVMTQAALDNYALANGFDKTTASMTEQEKVALRYDFVLDQLSAASGDFARTQEGWANQTRLLDLQWEELLTTMGSGLITTLTPGLQFLNDTVLPALQNAVEGIGEMLTPPPSDQLEKSMRDVAKSMESIEEGYQATAEEIDKTAVKADIYRGMLKDLEKQGVDTADAQAEYATIVEKLNELYPDLNLQIDEQTGLLDKNSAAMLENIDVMKERALMEAVEGKYADMLAAQAEATYALETAERSLNELRIERQVIEEQLRRETGLTMQQLYELDVAQRTGQETTQRLTAEQQALLLTLSLRRGEETQLENTIQESKSTIAEYEGEMQNLRETFGLVDEASDDLVESQEQVSETADEAKQSVEKLAKEYADAKKAAKDSIDSQIGLFDELVVKSETSAEDIVKNWQTQQTALQNYQDNLKKAIDMGLDEALVKQLSDGSVESMAILDAFVNDTSVSVDDLNAEFRKTEESRESVAGVMAGIQTDIASTFDAIADDTYAAWSGITEDVKDAVVEMQKAINSLTGKTVTLTIKQVKKSYSGKDMSLSNPSNQAVAAASVPYLASGAVIPPNAPFMAVLGDQRHGTNVEAPLSTIQEAVAAVMGDQVSAMMSGFEASVAKQQEILDAILGIEIGDSTIGQAATRYQRRQNYLNGGAIG